MLLLVVVVRFAQAQQASAGGQAASSRTLPAAQAGAVITAQNQRLATLQRHVATLRARVEALRQRALWRLAQAGKPDPFAAADREARNRTEHEV